VVKFDAIGRQNDFKKNPQYAIGFDKTTAKLIPSWKTFLNYWNENYKDLVIQGATEDICGDCFHLCQQIKAVS
jgi:hypothetical protein